jgi:hypothetical protein
VCQSRWGALLASKNRPTVKGHRAFLPNPLVHLIAGIRSVDQWPGQKTDIFWTDQCSTASRRTHHGTLIHPGRPTLMIEWILILALLTLIVASDPQADDHGFADCIVMIRPG